MPSLAVTDTNFKSEVLESSVPVLVDFWAEWCGPCKMITPIVEELAQEYAGKVKIAKVNVEEAAQTATNYGIMSIPTLMFFQNGKVAEQIVGVVSKDALKTKIERLI